MKGRGLRFFLPFAISGVLLLLVVRSIAGQSAELFAALASADWRLIVPAVLLYFVGSFIRSVRWKLLLPEQGVSVATVWRALIVGFTVNNLLPLRMGEVARAYLLARWGRVPYGATIASLIVERVLDGFTLALLLLLALRLVPSPPAYLLPAGVVAGAGFLGCAVLLALAAWKASLITATADWLARFAPERIGHGLQRVAASFARSLALVHGLGRLAPLLGLSLLAWCCELGLFFVLMFGFGLPASYPLALLVGSAANFATLVPSSPGYVGTFDGVLIKVLQDTIGTGAGIATAYAVVVHAALFLPVVVVGTLVLWRSNMTFTQITHAPDRGSASSAEGGGWPAVA
jgi:uncharacterized protein (TIRG00374 family)